VRRQARTAVVLVGALIGAGSVAGLPAASGLAAPATPSSAARTITLITGDAVSLAPAGDGRYAATVRPAPGRENISFRTTEAGNGLQVLPLDAPGRTSRSRPAPPPSGSR
jgi:hypothetical protein